MSSSRDNGRISAGKGRRNVLWSAVLTALAAQAVFWLPIKYRESRHAGFSPGENISILTPGDFSADELRRFSSWLERHDPTSFSRSDSPSGYAANLRETPAAQPSGKVPESAEQIITMPQVKKFVPPPLPSAVSRSLLPVSPLPPDETPRQKSSAAAPQVIITDGAGKRLDIPAAWDIPKHHTAVNATILRLGGLAEEPRWELKESCGDEVLDTLAVRRLNGFRKKLVHGQWLLVHWRTAPEVKK